VSGGVSLSTLGAILSKSHPQRFPTNPEGDLNGGKRGGKLVSVLVGTNESAEGSREKTSAVNSLSIIFSFQALKKVLRVDLSGSQDQNKHHLNNPRLTALGDGQENYPLEKADLSVSPKAPGCVSHLHAFQKCSLSPRPQLSAW
jgi:hypothetical protein